MTTAHALATGTSWPFYPELLATPVPRYTSYPTAAEFIEGYGRALLPAGAAAGA